MEVIWVRGNSICSPRCFLSKCLVSLSVLLCLGSTLEEMLMTGNLRCWIYRGWSFIIRDWILRFFEDRGWERLCKRHIHVRRQYWKVHLSIMETDDSQWWQGGDWYEAKEIGEDLRWDYGEDWGDWFEWEIWNGEKESGDNGETSLEMGMTGWNAERRYTKEVAWANPRIRNKR